VIYEEYNPNGACEAAEYIFPFRDESFDFVFLGSAFTHMLPRGVERYLSEIARAHDRENIICYYFLLTPETLDRIERGESTLPFTYEGSGFKAVSETLPGMAVAHEESYTKRRLYVQNYLSMIEPIRHGTWSHYVPKDVFGQKRGHF